jgi:hypothetical protein
MCYTLQIMVQTAQTTAQMADEMRALFGWTFRRLDVDGRQLYLYDNYASGASVKISTHDYESDEDFPLAEYPIEIDVNVLKPDEPEEVELAAQDALGARIFDGLAATGRWNLLLLKELDELLRTFER